MTNAKSGNVCKVHQSEIAKLNLPDSTKNTILSSGLPMTSVLCVSFATENGTFPTLEAYCRSNDLPQLEDGDQFYRIGTDEGSQICLKKGNGQVVTVDPNGDLEQRFVNSSIEMFLKLLEAYSHYADNVQSLSEEEANALAQQTVIRMREMDEHAFANPDSWWGAVGQQMEFGML